MDMDPSIRGLLAGDKVTIVVKTISDHMVLGLWHEERFSLPEPLGAGVWTLYDFLFQSVQDGVGQLSQDSQSLAVECKALGNSSFLTMKEVCAGIGGMALGARKAGCNTVVSVDKSKLACETVEMNGGSTILGDIVEQDIQKRMHLIATTDSYLLGAGIPCQPYSAQGTGGGMQDPRGQLLFTVLQIGWRQQVSGIILECVDTIAQFPEPLQLLRDFATHAGFSFHQVQLDLAHQWASRRRRWWSVLLPARLPPFELLVWNVVQPTVNIGLVIPEWPVWSSDVESFLLWTQEEKTMFEDARYGPECRLLSQTAQAPTALHSWSVALQPCPCGCREFPFSTASLLGKGLRGVGVISGLYKLPRHPHAAEAGLLNSLPVDFRHLPQPRAALSLVGNLAAPMQALWIFGQVTAWAGGFQQGISTAPTQVLLDKFRQHLLDGRKDLWLVPSQMQGGQLKLRQQQIEVRAEIPGPIRVSDVVQAQRSHIGWGCTVKVWDSHRRLPAQAFLHTGPLGPTYEVTIEPKKQVKPCASSAQAADPGCSDVIIWTGLLRLQAIFSRQDTALVPPTLASALCAESSSQQLSMQVAALWPLAMPHICIPFTHQGHWSLLFLQQVEVGQVTATLWDGIAGRSTAAATHLAGLFCAARRLQLASFRESSVWQQQSDSTCGTILLAHAACAFSGTNAAPQDFLQDAAAFVGAFPSHTASLYGKGGLNEQQTAKLSQILAEHGVPQAAVADRIQAAIQKIGASQVAQALQAKNTWQALKAAGSKPGISFKWVSAEELSAHIEQRAQTKFGTTVSKPKQKKKVHDRSRVNDLHLQVDARQLQMVAGSFLAAGGGPLPQLALEEVKTQASGVCFCQASQAMPFFAHFASMSTDALALLVTSEIPFDQCGGATVSHIRFPALFAPTQEGILIKGTLVQLGDEAVQLAQQGMDDLDPVPVCVMKVSVFRDELCLPWTDFTAAPVRTLVQHVPALTLCRDQQCKQDCSRYHAPVDEHTEQLVLDIWARNMSKLDGSRAPADSAEVFTAFWRVPQAAIQHLHRIQYPGLYFEPRSSDGGGPHPGFAVIWIPGADLAQAKHVLRTCDRTVAIARLGRKFGVRCREPDEQKLFELLRPQHSFIKIRINSRFRIHPLPHGVQRPAVAKLLAKWGWEGKPLQPLKGDSLGSAWEIGASQDPPSLTLPLGESYVLVTKQGSSVQNGPKEPAVLASSRTRQRILYDDPEGAQLPGNGTAASLPDPWAHGLDPWAKAKFGPPPGLSPQAPSQASQASTTKIEQIRSGLQDDVKGMLAEQLQQQAEKVTAQQQATDARLRQLESGMQELQAQNRKFEGWFGDVQNHVRAHKQEIANVKTELTNSFQSAVSGLQNTLANQMNDRFDAQLEQIQQMLGPKKPRTE